MQQTRTTWLIWSGVALVGGVGLAHLLAPVGLPLRHVLAQWGFFVLLTGLLFRLGHRAANSANPHLFTGVILGSVMGKLVFSLIFLFAYTRVLKPEGRAFLALFFGYYILFTILEIRVLQRLARSTGGTD